MLSFVPVHFAVYRPLKPRLRWAMQCLVSFADHAGRCFPSLRTFAVQAGISKSAAGRDLAELEAEGHLTRTRRPGGVYIYRISRRFLPRWAEEQVSQHGIGSIRLGVVDGRRSRRRVSQSAGRKKNQGRKTKGTARERASNSPNLDWATARSWTSAAEWQARLRSWRQSRFWLPLWGPKPTEPGCFAPPEVLTAAADCIRPVVRRTSPSVPPTMHSGS